MAQPPVTQDREHDERVNDRRAYEAVLERLAKASVDKHWEPYVDIPWDDPRFAIDPDDPRWKLSPDVDPLGAHPWYLAQPPSVQARIGLWRIAASMKVGMEFENLLKRGLLTYAYRLPNGSAEFRYIYHEVIEEGHHGMMFQEFVNRCGLPVEGMRRPMRGLVERTALFAKYLPGLFFFCVLSGEDPIDHIQRRILRSGRELHPLNERIIRIHVAEEARHISFARHYLRRRVPELGPVRRRLLALAVPVVLSIGARLMLDPPPAMIRHFGIPERVVDGAYRRNPQAREQTRRSLAKVRQLAVELGLVDPVSRRIWQALRIWA